MPDEIGSASPWVGRMACGILWSLKASVNRKSPPLSRCWLNRLKIVSNFCLLSLEGLRPRQTGHYLSRDPADDPWTWLVLSLQRLLGILRHLPDGRRSVSLPEPSPPETLLHGLRIGSRDGGVEPRRLGLRHVVWIARGD